MALHASQCRNRRAAPPLERADENRGGRPRLVFILRIRPARPALGPVPLRRRLRFRPNPSYPAHSIEARIFHAMAGKIWLDSRLKRLARLDGQVQENVDFGFGLLGRLYKGGWFQLQRTPVGPNDWKTQRLEIHMLGRALLLKNFSKETSETRGGFAPVPASMNLAQGVALLQKTVAGIDMQPHSGILMVNRDSSLNR